MLHYHFMIAKEFGEKKFTLSALSQTADGAAAAQRYAKAQYCHNNRVCLRGMAYNCSCIKS